MHGFFLSLKLYSTARLIANPQSYAEYRDRLVSDRLAAKAESRIRARKDQPKVNKALAERLRRSEKKNVVDGGVMGDERFREVLENPEFEVDQESREFALLNPATANNNVRVFDGHEDPADVVQAKRKTAVLEEDEESDRSSSVIGEGESESETEEEDSEDSEDGSTSQVRRTTCVNQAKTCGNTIPGPLHHPGNPSPSFPERDQAVPHPASSSAPTLVTVLDPDKRPLALGFILDRSKAKLRLTQRKLPMSWRCGDQRMAGWRCPSYLNRPKPGGIEARTGTRTLAEQRRRTGRWRGLGRVWRRVKRMRF